MCSKATCRKCDKTTWSGCGMHIAQVMRGVPAAQQCTCRGTAQQAAPVGATAPGRFRSLFGR